MTIDRNHPRWTAYVLGELGKQERAEFEKEMESTPNAEAILKETRDAVALLHEGYASGQSIYLSEKQTRAIKAEAAPRVPWFRNRFHWAMGGVAAAVVLLGVVTITVPNLLRSRQADDAGPAAASTEAPNTATLPATGGLVVRMDSEDRLEPVDGVQEKPSLVSETAPLKLKAPANTEAVRTARTEPTEALLPSAASEPVEESSLSPRQSMARIEGQVFDSTGAVVPGVEVTYTNEATGKSWLAVTNDSGEHNFPTPRPGSYLIQAELPGFKTPIRSGVQVGRGRNIRIDLTLEPGDISELVPVSGEGSSYSPPPFPAGALGNRRAFGGSLHTGPDRTRFNTEEYNRILDNPFVAVREDPLATFSIDVDTAAYANVRRFLNDLTLPPRDAVRIEEMVNYFTYDYEGPADEHPVRIHAEVAPAPWTPKHRLVRLGVKGREVPLEKRAPSNLVFLIDVSGSMQDADKLSLLKDGMKLLVEQLDENDRVAIVVYAGASGLVLPSTPGNQKRQLLAALDSLAAGGSTNGGAGIELAYDTAVGHFIKGGTNRVILATDGDFNVGVTDHGALTRLIEEKAETGVFLSVLGFGTGNYNDAGLEALAHHGNGNYAYIDTIREARKVLVEQMHSTLITIAKDVKIQVEFNPAEVNAYRLIGYENRVLEHPEFNDDTKNAGEIGSGHTVTALFEVVPADVDMTLPGVDSLKYQTPPRLSEDASRGELLTVKVRYKEPEGEVSRRMEITVADRDVPLSEASPDHRFAAAVAGFGMVLRDSPHKGDITLDSIVRLAEAGVGNDEEGYRAEFVGLVQKVGVLSLFEWTRHGNPAVVQALLAAGADPNVRNDNGDTLVHLAAQYNENPAVIQALLAAGADPNVHGWGNATPLHRAAANENLTVIEALLAAGTDPNVRDGGKDTPLHEAAGNGNPAVIQALLAVGADPNVHGWLNATPLHRAAANENFAVIEALLAAGADPNVRDDDKDTPLHEATRNKNPAVIQALLAAGADPNVRGENGIMPVHRAASNENPAVIQALLAARVDPNVRDDDKDTPLHEAAGNGNPAVIEALLAAGADPNVRNDYGIMPVHRAVKKRESGGDRGAAGGGSGPERAGLAERNTPALGRPIQRESGGDPGPAGGRSGSECAGRLRRHARALGGEE